MTIETTTEFQSEISGNNSLSPEEMQYLNERHTEDCETVQGDAAELCSALQVESVNNQEVIDGLKLQAGEYTGMLIRQLQWALGDIGVDGSFGNESANRILEKHPDLINLGDVFAAEGINTDIDGILSPSEDINVLQEVFEELYGDYIGALAGNLGLPDGFIQAVVRKESTYGSGLNSGTGAKGLMQLTKWPFKDMRGDHGDDIGVDSEKVLRYQNIFQRIDLDNLLSVHIGDKGEVRGRIPSEIIFHLRIIQESEDISQVQDSITVLFDHIKGNSREYDHETNMLVGSVYLAYQYDRAGGNLRRAARDYNGDETIAPNGREVRDNHADTVERYFNELQ